MDVIKLDPEELNLLISKYPFSFIQNLIKNKIGFEQSGDISMADVLELSRKTDNPGLALVASLKNKIILNSLVEKNVKENTNTEINTDINTLNDNIASEGLAKIFLKQGLKEDAIKIYKRISLLNNKNNSTFAKF